MDLKTSGEFMSGYTEISELLNSYFVSVFSEEEGGDLLKSGFSFPGTPEEELGTDTVSQILVLLAHPEAGCSCRGEGAEGCPGVQPFSSHKVHTTTGGVNESGQKPLSPILLVISHLLYKDRELKTEKQQFYTTSRQTRIEKGVFKDIINFHSFVFFSYLLENIIIAERVFNVTY